jgi:catechol 2,3-dioxygenase-like lactoylglutathione lyase family enzyme
MWCGWLLLIENYFFELFYRKITINMKRFHVHLRVQDLSQSIRFYQNLFGAEPTVTKPDYAKWMLDDPMVNFAISTGEGTAGIRHLGLQAESQEELAGIYENLEKAEGAILNEGETTCCYAKSQKSWIEDPQGVSWECFFTHGEATVYGEGMHSRPSPEQMDAWDGNDPIAQAEKTANMVGLPVVKSSCC